MRGTNNHYHYNYYISNNSSIRATLNANINCNSPKSFTHSPDANNHLNSRNFNQSSQSFSTKALQNYKNLITSQTGQQKQKGKTAYIPAKNIINNRIKNLREKQVTNKNSGTHQQIKSQINKEKWLPKSQNVAELRMTLDFINFKSRPQLQNNMRQTIFTPKPSTKGAQGFWKSKKNYQQKINNYKKPQKNGLKSNNVFITNKYKGINRFRLLKLIGQGTYSDVYLSIDKKNLTLWAIKRLKKSLIHSNQLKEQFIKMIGNQYKLNHPNIMKIYDFFCDENYIYLVQQFMEGGSLERYMIRKKKLLTQNDIGEKISEISSAINHIHKKNLIHGDLKPSSILICHDTCKLPSLQCLDKGTLNFTTLFKDSNYTPPQALSSKVVSSAFDLWCLGLIFYELVVQKPLFSGTTHKVIMRKIVNFTIEQIKLSSQIFYQIEYLIKSLLNPNPKQRMKIQQLIDHNFIVEHRTDNEWNSIIKTQNGSTLTNKTSEQ